MTEASRVRVLPATALPRAPRIQFRLDRWSAGTLALALLVAIPVVSVIGLALSPTDDIWAHLSATVLPGYVANTLGLALGVAAGTLAIGVGTAWLVTMTRFPGRRVFEWALLLPLAMPAYIVAYVYTGLLEYAGPVQGALRALFGWQGARDYWFPEIRSLGGAIAVMTLVLYPYVYLLARAAFLEQCLCLLEVSRTLGRGPWRSFFAVALPLARPGIAVGLMLVLMETLNDFGTVDYFAVPTFTAGIFRVWLGMNSAAGAAQLALVLLGFVLVVIGLERVARMGQRYHHTTGKYRPLPGTVLAGPRGWLAFFACLAPILLGFAVPAATLARLATLAAVGPFAGRFLETAANSLALSIAAAALTVGVGVFLAYGLRMNRSPLLKALARFAGSGYALPGAVLALGVMIPFARFDNALDAFMRETFGVSTGLLLSGTVVALVFAYVARFLALSFATVEASLGKVTMNMDSAARILGHGPASTLRRVHVPLLKGSLLTAGVLVFVDAMKELPMTLILRPFNFETMATYVYQYAGDERLEACALAALAIVATGILPVILMSRTIGHSRPGQPLG
ncbi:MAG: iron ABC transporter permease [Proteobacteria bacterium]|nr:iron ABC transporter permease [Pseudomonadota bacterium]